MPDHPLCLLFDCDGTLVDSEPLLADVMSLHLNKAGLPFTPADYMQKFRGERFGSIVSHLEDQYGRLNKEDRQALETNMRQDMHERMLDELSLIEGISDALTTLQDIPCCVASNGPDYKIRRALESTGLSGFFGDRIYSAYTIGHWKPDPGLFLYAAKDMGFSPEECIVIDDAKVGVQAALKAGMQVIHINRFPEQETTLKGAACINSMSDLVATIERLRR